MAPNLGPPLYRLWEFYLAGAVMLFETGSGCNYQVQFIHDRSALPINRDYMVEQEKRYRVAEAA